ncbi:MAG: glycoside hydrolase family 43 protein [Planctomycetota bacterium]|jgi:beta-xylosidase
MLNLKLLRNLSIALIVCIAWPITGFSGGPGTGTWGDQGDGSYKNPILNADYPDVDIEKVGDMYYMITSTIHYAPGMTLLESKDIVNWRLIGHVFDKLTWEPKYNFDSMSGYAKGVYAGDFAYHEGKWYCYFIDATSGLYMSSADRIDGKWSEAKLMLRKTRWTDPTVYWDQEEKQAYLFCNFGRRDDSHGNHLKMFKMSWDGERLLDKGKFIYKGQGAEAAKIYKINGEYYIFLAQWIKGDRKQLVLRGKSIYGPFERRIVMEKVPGALRSTSQGALLQAPDGSWWLTHQLIQHREKKPGQDGAGPSTDRSYAGRSQWLVPVKWEDGWPVVGDDPDGNGIGSTVAGAKKPVLGYPIDAPQTDDEFDSAELSAQWQWNHNPRDDRWSLSERPGWLRLKANVPVGKGGFWNASNTLSQRLMGMGRGEITCKVDISAMKPGQEAGIARHSGQYVLLGVSVGKSGVKRLVFNNNDKVTVGPVIDEDVIWYRTINEGRRAWYEYSLEGKNFERFGEEFQLRFGRWRGDRPGFYCWNNIKAQGHIDIDYFHYDYDGPKGKKP